MESKELIPGGEKEIKSFYKKLRTNIRQKLAVRRPKSTKSTFFEKLIEYLAALPDLFHLSFRLLFDRQVPAEKKGALVAGIAYVVSPLDLIPDHFGVAGWIDDLIVITMALHNFLDADNEEIAIAINKYWAGDENVFELIKHILATADAAVEFLPKKLMKTVKGMFPR